MRLLLQLLLIICSSVTAYSQSWTAPNPIWHFNYGNVGEWGFITIEQTGDSLIENHTCQVLSATKHMFFHTGPQGNVGYSVFPYGINYVYASGDTVFYYQDTTFRVLFDFSAQPGDSWLLASTDPGVFGGCGDTSLTLVDAVSTVDLGTETAIELELSFHDSNQVYQSGTYNSHFGAMSGYLFPQYRTCDQSPLDVDMIGFCSFHDDLLDFNPTGEDCEYPLTHLGLNEQEQQKLTVYPNPAATVLNVELPSGAYAYTVVSLTGQKVQSGEISSDGKVELNTGNLKSGVYMLELSDAEGMYSRVNFAVR